MFPTTSTLSFYWRRLLDFQNNTRRVNLVDLGARLCFCSCLHSTLVLDLLKEAGEKGNIFPSRGVTPRENNQSPLSKLGCPLTGVKFCLLDLNQQGNSALLRHEDVLVLLRSSGNERVCRRP